MSISEGTSLLSVCCFYTLMNQGTSLLKISCSNIKSLVWVLEAAPAGDSTGEHEPTGRNSLPQMNLSSAVLLDLCANQIVHKEHHVRAKRCLL